MAEGSASRAALLALRRDRRVIEEGHRFLDEKRVALAHELLRRTREYEGRRAAFLQQAAEARAALAAAVSRHGLEGLQVYPAQALTAPAPARPETVFLGVRLVGDAQLALTGEAGAADRRTLEGERCAARYRELAAQALPLAGAIASLLRLMREYRRTERRVRALENIVLPEARADERRFEGALEELDQEEVLRSRLFAVEELGGDRDA